MNRIIETDILEGIALLEDRSVHTVVTSPPYFQLRDYGLPNTHFPKVEFTFFGVPITIPAMDCQLGLENTPMEFIGHLVHIFREVHRVLRDDGTVWVNMGDSYATGAGGNNMKNATVQKMAGSNTLSGEETRKDNVSLHRKPFKNSYLKSKDLMGIPWMMAFALREDGWYLRQDIIWSKPNPMPESCTDRCTKSHEYIFLLSKKPKYYYDAEAIKSISTHLITKMPDGWDTGEGSHGSIHRNGREKGAKISLRDTFKRENSSRQEIDIPNQKYATHRSDREDTFPTGFANKRSVWTVASVPYKEAHFATFPPKLIEDCIKAGSSTYGCCKACGMPYRRQVYKELVPTSKAAKTFVIDARDGHADPQDQGSNRQKDGHKSGHIYSSTTTGWVKECSCDTNEIEPCTVLDIFGGSGTTGEVAQGLGRKFILIEAKPSYVQLIHKRMNESAPLFNQNN